MSAARSLLLLPGDPPPPGGGVVFVDATAEDGSYTTSVSTPLPSGVTDGMILIDILGADYGSPPTPPAGFTPVTSQGGTNLNQLMTGWLLASGETGPYVATVDSNASGDVLAILAFSGVDETDPILDALDGYHALDDVVVVPGLTLSEDVTDGYVIYALFGSFAQAGMSCALDWDGSVTEVIDVHALETFTSNHWGLLGVAIKPITQTAGNPTGSATATLDILAGSGTAFEWDLTNGLVWAVLVLRPAPGAGGGDETATPSAVTAVASIPAVTLLASATATPAVVTAVASVPAPTLLASATPAPAVVTAVASIPAPTPLGSATVEPSAVTAVASIPLATPTSAVIATPAAVTAVASIPAPTLLASATTTPAAVLAPASIPTPTPLGTALVAPSAVVALASIGAPTLLRGATPTPAVVLAVASIPLPAVQTGSSVTVPAAAVVALASVPAPTLVGTATVSAAVVLAVASIPTPGRTGSATVTPGAVVALTTIPVPVRLSGAFALPGVVVAITSIPLPSRLGGAEPTPGVVVAVTVIPTPGRTSSALLAPLAVLALVTIGAPTIRAGSGIGVAAGVAHAGGARGTTGHVGPRASTWHGRRGAASLNHGPPGPS